MQDLNVKLDFVTYQSLKKFYVCQREYHSAMMQRFIANPDAFITEATGPFFKNGIDDTTTICVITIDDKKFVVKRYNLKNTWHNLTKILRASRAMRSWSNSQYLLAIGIKTPKPIAVIINKHFWLFRGKTYFLTEYVEGVRGCDFFGANQEPTELWPEAVNNIVNLIQKLHDGRITHDDLQFGNMLLAGALPYLLDLDHMRIHKHRGLWFRHLFRKDIEHFLDFLRVNPKAHEMFVQQLVPSASRSDKMYLQNYLKQ